MPSAANPQSPPNGEVFKDHASIVASCNIETRLSNVKPRCVSCLLVGRPIVALSASLTTRSGTARARDVRSELYSLRERQSSSGGLFSAGRSRMPDEGRVAATGVPEWLVRYLAITLNVVRPISSAPREAVTITFQVPPIES